MKDKSQRQKKGRMWELDFFRGFAIIMVVWDHLMFNLIFFNSIWRTTDANWLKDWGIFGANYYDSYLRLFWRPVFLFIFFSISGIVTVFSKNNLIRGLKLALVAVAVSVFTYTLDYFTGSDVFILMGVLHCLALTIIIYALTSYVVEGMIRIGSYLLKKEYSEKFKRTLLALLCLALSGVLYWIHLEYNTSLYATSFYTTYIQTDKNWMGLFFFVYEWATADYFPLFPFISFFFFGAGLTQFLYPNKKSLLPSLDGKWHLPFTIAGRYSLIIYLASQVLMFASLALITYIATGIFIFD